MFDVLDFLVFNIVLTESLREPLVNTGVLPHLLRHLSSKHIALATQACRALGNICYDNGKLLSLVECPCLDGQLNVHV